MRILLIEDDDLLGDGLKTGLVQENYTVDWVQNGNLALSALKTQEYDLVVLDLGLPGISGLEVLSQFRKTGNTTPVLILTARDHVEDRVKGLDTGADDYLVKPFDLEELFARLRALHRRRVGQTDTVLTHGDITLDPATHEITKAGKSVALSVREFVVLQHLLENVGRVIPRARLEDKLYGWDNEIESNSVEVFIHHIRKKLGSKLINTIRGVGYVIEKNQ